MNPSLPERFQRDCLIIQKKCGWPLVTISVYEILLLTGMIFDEIATSAD
jgi:hypothetical protein